MTNSGDAELTKLAQRLLQGDKRALARAITLVERDDPEGRRIVREVFPHTGRASVLGFTGPPGAGKSTLLGVLTARERAQGRTVAVLAVDPSSQRTSGALLGDRVRLTEHFLDQGVFIRSMASRGALGGLSEAVLQTALLMDASGADVVLVETVGVGQGEVEIGNRADTVVLVLMPGFGDSIQVLKAGVMEIPDVIVVNKADHPQTDAFVRELKATLALAPREGWRVPVLSTQALTGGGVDELLCALDEHQAYLRADGALVQRRRLQLHSEVIGLALSAMRRQQEAAILQSPEASALIERVAARELDPASAAAEIARRIGITIGGS